MKNSFMRLFGRLTCFFLIIFSNVYANGAMDKFSSICDEDQADIKVLFHYLIYESTCPYTLFGDKPISTVDCIEETNPFYFADSAYRYALKKCFVTWKKYEALFSLKKFQLILMEHPSQKTFSILLLNREACLKVIKSHLSLFQRLMKMDIDENAILNCIELSPDFFDTVLNGHQGLYGLLLGYGEKNSLAFHEIYEENSLSQRTLTPFNKEDYNAFVIFEFQILWLMRMN